MERDGEGKEPSSRLVRREDDLFVYRQARANADLIYRLSRDWPDFERFALTGQVLRSSRSACANISEAWSKRRYRKHFVSKLTDADGEVAETRTWLSIAQSCGYLDSDEFEALLRSYHTVMAGLARMMKNPDRWCGPSRLR